MPQYAPRKAPLKIHSPSAGAGKSSQQQAQQQQQQIPSTPQQVVKQEVAEQQYQATLSTPTGQTVQAHVPVNKGSKPFVGFKSKLIMNVPGLTIDTDIRYGKTKSKSVLPQIEMMTAQGEEVEYRPDAHYRYGYFVKSGPRAGQEISESEVKYYQVFEDGHSEEVSPFTKSEAIKIEKYLSMPEMETFVPESFYEVWSDHPETLSQVAEYLSKTDQVGVAKISLSKGFKAYYAMIYPYKVPNSDEFGLEMMLTTGRKDYQHLMNAKNAPNSYQKEEKHVQGVLEEI